MGEPWRRRNTGGQPPIYVMTATIRSAGSGWWAGKYVVQLERVERGIRHRERDVVEGAMAEIAGSNPATGAYRYYVRYNLGSTRAVYDGTKALAAVFAYTPHGQDYASLGASSTTHRFTGHDWNPQSNLYFAPHRYYNPKLARWMSRDPLGMMDGPNLYLYALAGPVTTIDALGLACVRVFTQKRWTSGWEGRGKVQEYVSYLDFGAFARALWTRREIEERDWVRQTEWYCVERDSCGRLRSYWKTTYTHGTDERIGRRVDSRNVNASRSQNYFCSINPWTQIPHCTWNPTYPR
jgi:RHS repeat-associated protein